MDEALSRQVNDLQEAINSIRKTVMTAQVEQTAQIADCKRDQAENLMNFKYLQSEAQVESAYTLRHELSDMLAQIKGECTTRNESRKTWVSEQLANLRELLETKIAAKMKATLISSAVLFVFLSVLGTLVLGTRTNLEDTKDRTYADMAIFKEQITQQLTEFKQDIREEFGVPLAEIRENQIEMNTLMRIYLGSPEHDIYKTRPK